MENHLEAYLQSREALLRQITEELSSDERFVAAWLTGSIARNEADSLSDIDLSVVVADAHSPNLCTRLEQVSAQTSPERYALFRQFGKPASFTKTIITRPKAGHLPLSCISGSALRVDWILVTQSNASRPNQSPIIRKGNIPFLRLEPEELEAE